MLLEFVSTFSASLTHLLVQIFKLKSAETIVEWGTVTWHRYFSNSMNDHWNTWAQFFEHSLNPRREKYFTDQPVLLFNSFSISSANYYNQHKPAQPLHCTSSATAWNRSPAVGTRVGPRYPNAIYPGLCPVADGCSSHPGALGAAASPDAVVSRCYLKEKGVLILIKKKEKIWEQNTVPEKRNILKPEIWYLIE